MKIEKYLNEAKTFTLTITFGDKFDFDDFLRTLKIKPGTTQISGKEFDDKLDDYRQEAYRDGYDEGYDNGADAYGRD